MNFREFADKVVACVEDLPLNIWSEFLPKGNTPHGLPVLVKATQIGQRLPPIRNSQDITLIVSGKNPVVLNVNDTDIGLEVSGRGVVLILESGLPMVAYACNMNQYMPSKQFYRSADHPKTVVQPPAVKLVPDEVDRKGFANEQVAQLMVLGLSSYEANRLIDASKVSASVSAAKWFFGEIADLQDINEDETPAKSVSAMKSFLTGIFIRWAKEVAFRKDMHWTEVAREDSVFFDLLLSGDVDLHQLVKYARTDIETERYEPIEGSDRHFILQLRGIFELISLMQERMRNQARKREFDRYQAQAA